MGLAKSIYIWEFDHALPASAEAGCRACLGCLRVAATQIEISVLCEPFGLLPMGIRDGEIPRNGW